MGYILGTPPLSNSWIVSIIWVYIALNRTPNIDCYWGGSTQAISGLAGNGESNGEEVVQWNGSCVYSGVYGDDHAYSAMHCRIKAAFAHVLLFMH